MSGTSTLGSLFSAAGKILSNPSVAATVGTVAAGITVASTFAKSADAATSRIRRASSPQAITSVSRQAMIQSRVYMDEAIMDETVIPNLMRCVHQWYVAQILTALGLNTLVTSSTNVGQVLNPIQTGYNKPFVGLESFEALSYTSPAAKKSSADQDTGSENNSKVDEEQKYKNIPTTLKTVDVGSDKVGPFGELYEVTLRNPDKPEYATTVPIYIQMQPTIVPHQFAARFIDMNVPASIWQRWTQWSAGEISFVRDFLFSMDRVKKYQDIVKDPEASAAFSDFLKSTAKKNSYNLRTHFIRKVSTAAESKNLANSVMILSEDAVRQAKLESGIDLHKASDRERYFTTAYSMIVAVIDPLHQRLTIYFNGIDGDLNIPYSDLKPKNSKFEPADFIQALQAFSTNAVGRLR